MQMIFRHADFLPELISGLVMWLISHIKLLDWDAETGLWIGEDFESPWDDFVAEIIADGEVTKHLEEGMMTRGVADVFDVVGTDGFLDVNDTSAWRNLAAIEVFL